MGTELFLSSLHEVVVAACRSSALQDARSVKAQLQGPGMKEVWIVWPEATEINPPDSHCNHVQTSCGVKCRSGLQNAVTPAKVGQSLWCSLDRAPRHLIDLAQVKTRKNEAAPGP